MNKIEGLHHLAIATGDMKAQIGYFTDKLGMELQALYWMHGVANTFHGFLRLNDESSIALVYNPEIKNIPATLGTTHAGNAGANCAPGTMQHLAFKVEDGKALYAMRDRLRSRGVPVLGPIDHGLCKSIYFAGLENLTLELSCSDEPINNERWVDPEVVELLGITPQELAGYKSPADYSDEGVEKGADEGGRVPQPGVDAPGPHLNYPADTWATMLATPDAAFLNSVPNEPPVQSAHQSRSAGGSMT